VQEPFLTRALSMTDRTVYKQLAGLEDLLFGRGTVNQSRGGATYPITKISVPLVVTSVAALVDVDKDQFPTVIVVNGIELTVYENVAGTWTPVKLLNELAKAFAS